MAEKWYHINLIKTVTTEPMPRNIERERTESTNNADILVIGAGEVGKKAQQFIDKTPTLRALGFRTPHRTVFAEGFFDNFFQRNGLGANLRDASAIRASEEDIRRGSLTQQQFDVLQVACLQYGNTPLVIRSSAAGDARGTGTYKSIFSENQIRTVRKGLQEVLSSYFSPDAMAFRRDAATGEGFGIIVEPVIGQALDGSFAPVLSGFGYTSTSRGGGYINVVPGLGGGVESRDGEQISRSRFEEHGGTLGDYIFLERDGMFMRRKATKRSALLRTDRNMFYGDYYCGQAFTPATRHQKAVVSNTSFVYPDDIQRVLDDLNLMPFFQSMEQMEQVFGKPQYFEWAMTVELGKPIFWIVQIADVDKKLDLMEFGNFGRVMFMGHTVTGTGIKEAIKVVNCWNPGDISSLSRFNQNNRNYVLVFSSKLTSRGGARHRLSYSDFSNACVFLEIQEAMHIEGSVAHLGGQLDMAGKLFAVLDYDAEIPPDWDLFHEGEQKVDGLTVFDGKIKVVASERQNKLVLYVEDKKS